MTAKKKAEQAGQEPRRVNLTSGQAWRLQTLISDQRQALAETDGFVVSILHAAGIDNDKARWILELGEEIALVEKIE